MILCKEEYAKKIDSAVFPGQQGGPLEHIIAGKAVALRIAATEAFRERQERTLAGARAVAEELLGAGGGVSVLTGGTDVHLVLCDLRESSSTASRPRTGCTRSGSPSTATRSRSTRARRRCPPAADRQPGAGHAGPAGRGLHRGGQDHRVTLNPPVTVRGPAGRAGRARRRLSPSATRCTRSSAPPRWPEPRPGRWPGPARGCGCRCGRARGVVSTLRLPHVRFRRPSAGVMSLSRPPADARAGRRPPNPAVGCGWHASLACVIGMLSLAFFVALVVSTALTPLAARLARRIGAVDVPARARAWPCARRRCWAVWRSWPGWWSVAFCGCPARSSFPTPPGRRRARAARSRVG